MAVGYTVKRGKAWSIVVDGPRGEDGRRKLRYISGRQLIGRPFKTRKEAEAHKAKILVDQMEGRFADPSEVTVKEYIEHWLDSLDLRPSTVHSYRTKIRVHILPVLGGIKLQKLSSADLTNLYRDMAARGLSARSVQFTHAIIRKALQDAIAEDPPLLVRNVADRAKKPSAKAAKAPEMHTWSAEELRTFLEQTREDRLYPAWVLLASTGMRRGELLGLTWRDIDLVGSSLSVRRSVTRVQKEYKITPPKSGKARTVDLDAGTLAVLRAWRKRQTEEQLYAGPAWQDHGGIVFTNEDGTPVRPDNLSRHFNESVADSGLPRIRLHDLRHTSATLALRTGIHPKIVQERLGHANITLTLDLYSHAVPGLQREAAKQVGALVFGPGS